ncbi:hypothetical protein PUN28_004744 [Cardiocondyla obscurior]|uniref:Uncharacterized protein n=1 Tax=Cardiocondyla obscurior TaxID=286306 RepID=A0AAW2GCE4_9HYME
MAVISLRSSCPETEVSKIWWRPPRIRHRHSFESGTSDSRAASTNIQLPAEVRINSWLCIFDERLRKKIQRCCASPFPKFVYGSVERNRR